MALSTPRLVAGVALLFGFAAALPAADWPGFLGPNRTGASAETGLLTAWTGAQGPKVLWKVEGGDGYSGIAVAGGKVFTLVQRGKEEVVLALDAKSGKEVWKYTIGPAYKNQYGDGPRATPTVDGKRVYIQSANGPLLCLDADGGKVVWQHDLLKEFKVKNISWGLSASPLVEGTLVLVQIGDGGGVAAFDKETGKLLWKVGTDKAGYASPVVMTAGGKKQAVFFTGVSLLAVDLAAGKELWRIPWKTDFDCNIATPQVIGDKLFVSSGENVGCAMLQPAASGEPKVVWESKGANSVMKNYWMTSVYSDKHLYGVSSEHDPPAHLRCLDAATGKIIWEQSRFGMANLTLGDGHLWIITVGGDLVVAEASPKGYQEKGRAKVLDPAKYANAPAIADKKLYARDLKSIICLDIAGK